MNDHLLDAQLADLAREDARDPTPAHVETRTLAAWDDWTRARAAASASPEWRRRWKTPALVALAASVLFGLVLPRPWIAQPRPAPAPRPGAAEATEPRGLSPEPLALTIPPAAADPSPPVRRRSLALSRRAGGTVGTVESARFIPLGPDAEYGLSGSFQLARVRVPRDVLVDLGLLVDAHRGGEPVQADVVFGEDGLAKAIRLAPVSRRVP